ncbi:unnamed protein product, partial [Vitis vinifera]|uniref:Uncharacterized protein n=1 Tax=Vitis vinifera TaxID=29760 RepID=D7TNV4_VITVI
MTKTTLVPRQACYLSINKEEFFWLLLWALPCKLTLGLVVPNMLETNWRLISFFLYQKTESTAISNQKKR